MKKSQRLNAIKSAFSGDAENSSSDSASSSKKSKSANKSTSTGDRKTDLSPNKVISTLRRTLSSFRLSLPQIRLNIPKNISLPKFKRGNNNQQSESKSKKTTKRKRALWKSILFFPIINPVGRLLVLATVVFGLAGLVYLLRDLPSPRKLTSSDNFAVSTQIFDRNGELLYEIIGDEHRVPISLEDLPPHVYQASIAIEDQRFYRHFGVDILGIIRALNNNLRGQPIEGGSTITQQLVKNALLTRERTITRKIKEALLAIITEIIYSKEQILEMYLNYISYGGTAVGIESAAQQYFDKPASELTLEEASLLAGLPQAPSRYSPFQSDPTKSKNRQADVLRRMAEDGYITPLEAESAMSEPLNFAISKTDIRAPHFVFYVRDLLYEQYGEEMVERGGLRVYTTLDLGLQEVVQASVSAEINALERYQVGNGAALVTKPNTGEILAMVGSRDYFDEEKDGQVNVTLALRQPGSSIKPLVYAAAFQEKLINPGTIILDVPTCFEIPNQKAYCPKNYDGTFKGPIEIRKALGNSLNIPAVKVMRLLGVERFIDFVQPLGLTTLQDPSRYGLSLALGGGEVRMIDMAQAFSVLANEGVKVPLTPILKIEDYTGELITEVDIEARQEALAILTEYDGEEQEGDLTRVMDKAPAYLAAHIMQDNNARQLAFGPRSELVIPNQIVSAKTGTTNDLKDNWTVGFTPEFLTIAWVGNNDSSPMNPYLVSGVTGAAPIWNDIMSYILAEREPVWQQKPADVASAGVCATGVPPQQNQNCNVRYTELFWKRSRPSESGQRTEDVWINPATGLPIQPGESVDGAVVETRSVYTDPLTQYYCSDCNRPTNTEGEIQYERYIIQSGDN